MYKKILVPLDGSALASDALPHVREIAACAQAQVSLLQITPMSAYNFDAIPQADLNAARWSGFAARTLNSVNETLMVEPALHPEWIESQSQAAQNYLDAIADGLIHAGIAVETVVESGAVAQTILDTADNKKADLIVMTTHGRSGIGRFLLGGAADRVVNYARVPVLLIRSQDFAEWRTAGAKPTYKRLLVPLDGSDVSTAVLDDVREMALCTHAEVLLLRVIHEPNDWVLGEVMFELTSGLVNMDNDTHAPGQSPASAHNVRAARAEHLREAAQQSLDAAADELRRAGVRVETLIQRGGPAETILEAARNCHADMIALATHGRSGLTRFLMGSVARQIVEHAQVPVLLVRAPAR